MKKASSMDLNKYGLRLKEHQDAWYQLKNENGKLKLTAVAGKRKGETLLNVSMTENIKTILATLSDKDSDKFGESIKKFLKLNKPKSIGAYNQVVATVRLIVAKETKSFRRYDLNELDVKGSLYLPKNTADEIIVQIFSNSSEGENER